MPGLACKCEVTLRPHNSVIALIVAVIAWSACATLALAADTGSIRGSVTDPAGVPIAGARIVLDSSAARESTASDAAGGFAFANIPAATYVITAEAKGFSPIAARLLPITAGNTTAISLVMERVTTGSISTLGRVVVNGRQALSTASAPSVNIDPQDLAGKGIENVADLLGEQIAVTMTRPAGGAPGLPQSASLRGPDPSETLIDVDGHVVNNANTGDFDLELLDPSMFSDIQVVYGVGPSSLDGANTQGGTINFHTLDPTPQDHGLIRAILGNFGTSGYTLQATGSDQRLGYAMSFHHYYSAGAVNGYPVTDTGGANVVLGSAINATSSLFKLRYSLGLGDGFVEATYRNTAAYRDLTAPLSFPNDPTQVFPGASFSTFPGAASLTNSPAYGLDVQLPMGERGTTGAAPATLIVRHLTNITDQSAPGVPPGSNPYLLDDRDAVYDDSAEIDRYLPDGSLSLLADVRVENLALPSSAPFAAGVLDQRQTQRSFAGRYEWDASAHIHYTLATYFSRYDTFGTSVDPRFALAWTPSADSVVRFSYGTGFRAPLLTERAINPTLTAEHTSEFEVGFEHRFSQDHLAPTIEIDAYRTSLRDPIFFVPNPNPQQGQFSFIENLANVIYAGVEFRADKPLSPSATLHASYGIDIAYPMNDPFAFDPSAPNVVSGQQFQSIPPHKALLSVDGHGSSGFGYAFGAGYESSNNELNRPSYWLFNASVAQQLHNTTVSLGVQNLTNEFADKFTLNGLGPLYPTPAGPVPTNAYSLPGRTLTFVVTQRM
jgi:outer membrane receptor protein involved in Fe transport